MLTSIVFAGVTSSVALLGILVGVVIARHRGRCGASAPDGCAAELEAVEPRGQSAADAIVADRRDAPPRGFPFPVTTTFN